MLDGVGDGFADDEVGGGLDVAGEALVEADVDVHWQRGTLGEEADGGFEAFLGEDGGVDAAGHLAQRGQRLGQLMAGVVDLGGDVVVTGRRGVLGDGLQAEGEGDQLLLGAVVEVALDAPAGLVLGGDDSFPGSLQFRRLQRDLLQSVLQLDAETDVVDDEAGLGDEIVEQSILGRGQRLAGRFGERDRPPQRSLVHDAPDVGSFVAPHRIEVPG